MRKALAVHLRETRDLGFLPEFEAWQAFEGSSGWQVGKSGSLDLKTIGEAASSVGLAKEKTLIANLRSPNPKVRYWGAIGLTAHQQKPTKPCLNALEKALTDSSPSVRIEAANALAKHGYMAAALPILISELEHENLIVVTHSARTIELLGEQAEEAIPAMRACLKRAHKIRPPDLSPVIVLPGDQDMAMFVGFSCQAFLDQFKDSD
jgi:hypothetical protein